MLDNRRIKEYGIYLCTRQFRIEDKKVSLSVTDGQYCRKLPNLNIWSGRTESYEHNSFIARAVKWLCFLVSGTIVELGDFILLVSGELLACFGVYTQKERLWLLMNLAHEAADALNEGPWSIRCVWTCIVEQITVSARSLCSWAPRHKGRADQQQY